MQPLVPAHIPNEEAQTLYKDVLEKWLAGDPIVRKAIRTINLDRAREAIAAYVRDEVLGSKIWKNDTYQVAVRDGGPFVHLSVKRIDRQCIHDWRDLQAIKNQLVGPECEGVELYPAESRLVDTANQYHIWAVKDPKFRFQFGFEGRFVTEHSLGKSVNRKFE